MLPKLHLAPNHVSFLLKQFALVVGISPSCTVQRTLELTLTKAPVLCPHGCQGSDRNTNNNRSNSKGNFSLGERIRWKHFKKWIRSTIWNNFSRILDTSLYVQRCPNQRLKESCSVSRSQNPRWHTEETTDCPLLANHRHIPIAHVLAKVATHLSEKGKILFV